MTRLERIINISKEAIAFYQVDLFKKNSKKCIALNYSGLYETIKSHEYILKNWCFDKTQKKLNKELKNQLEICKKIARRLEVQLTWFYKVTFDDLKKIKKDIYKEMEEEIRKKILS